MLARFLTAGALATAVAAVLAGADTPAQAPPAQQPAAAEQQAKLPKEWPPDADTLRKRRLEAEALPLFAGQEPIEVTLTANWRAVQRDRNVESKKTYPG